MEIKVNEIDMLTKILDGDNPSVGKTLEEYEYISKDTLIDQLADDELILELIGRGYKIIKNAELEELKQRIANELRGL